MVPRADPPSSWPGPITVRTARITLGVLLVVMAMVTFASVVRLVPWLLDPRVPWGAVSVFARGLLVSGLQIAGAVALPLGFALTAAGLSDRGEARAILLTGTSPWRASASTWPLALVITAMIAATGVVWGREAARPGRTLGELADSAREGCDGGKRISDIPGTSAAWLCVQGDSPRLAMASETTVITASRVVMTEDTRSFALADVEIALRGPPQVNVHVDEASFEVPRPVVPASSLSPLVRGIASAAAAWIGAIAAMATLLATLEGRRLFAVGLGGAAAALPLWVLGALEQSNAPPLAYVLVPSAAALPSALMGAFFRFRARGDGRERTLRAVSRDGKRSLTPWDASAPEKSCCSR
jgi:hypothetical protein